MSFGVQSAGLFSTSVLASTTSSTTTNSLRPFANLDLTEDQRKKIRDIFKTAKADGLSDTQIQDQINAVLTPDQLTTLENDIATSASGTAGTKGPHGPHGPPPGGGNPFSDPNGPFANLNLTSDQQSQISQILQDAKSQGLTFDQINTKINAILTTAQQTTFASDLQNLKPPPGANDSSDASTASASVSGQSQTGDDDSTASGTAVSAADIQKQIAAAAALVLKQLQYELGVSA